MTNKKLIAKLNKLDSHAEIFITMQGVKCRIVDVSNDYIITEPTQNPSIDAFKDTRAFFERSVNPLAINQDKVNEVAGVPKHLMGKDNES